MCRSAFPNKADAIFVRQVFHRGSVGELFSGLDQ
jgi:hypothetical protein